MKMNGKTAAAAMSALALAGMSVAPMAAMAAPGTVADTAGTEAVQVAENAGAAGFVRADRVEGTFSFDQQTVTPTATIANVFAKAAATLCQAMPAYVSETATTSLLLSAPNSLQITATIQDLAARDGNPGVIMACACATNGPGGGAAANAEVEGASVASLAALAGAA